VEFEVIDGAGVVNVGDDGGEGVSDGMVQLEDGGS
jgi:hypothetical protein